MTDFTVVGPSGVHFEVIHIQERDYWNSALERYVSEFKFENISDLQDLDRVLMGEVLCYRWGSWLIREADYDGRSIEEIAPTLQKNKLDQEKEVRLLKEKMGLNRARRQDSDAQSAADFIGTLLRRAKEFGVHRDHEIAKARDLWFEALTQVGLYYRSDEEERAHLGVTAEEIIEWINTKARDEFEAIDNAFRVNQKSWIKEVA